CLNVSNGRELLDFLDTSLILPDLILLDINMPVMNGRACLKEIKRDPRLKHIPVVIFTTSKNEQDRQLCIELGATDFLLKPTTSHQATEQLKGLLSSIA
ncbi:MAG TPA: response regulator, partial [Ohtaekwangia sp.]